MEKAATFQPTDQGSKKDKCTRDLQENINLLAEHMDGVWAERVAGVGRGLWVLKYYRRNPSLVSYVSTTFSSVFRDTLPECNRLFARSRCFEQNVDS